MRLLITQTMKDPQTHSKPKPVKSPSKQALEFLVESGKAKDLKEAKALNSKMLKEAFG